MCDGKILDKKIQKTIGHCCKGFYLSQKLSHICHTPVTHRLSIETPFVKFVTGLLAPYYNL